MAIKTDYHNNKHHLRHHVIPDSNEGLDIGLAGQRFHTGRFKALIADTVDAITLTFTTVVTAVINTLTVSTALTLSFLTGPGYLKIDSSEAVGLQAVPIPLADGGTGATSLAAGYIKSNGTVFSSQTVPIPIADGGTNAITAAAARTSLGSTTVGDAVFVSSSAAVARTALGAAPLDPTFVTLSTNAELSNERVLTAGTAIQFVDNGAGGTLVISSVGSFNPIANQVFGG